MVTGLGFEHGVVIWTKLKTSLQSDAYDELVADAPNLSDDGDDYLK